MVNEYPGEVLLSIDLGKRIAGSPVVTGTQKLFDRRAVIGISPRISMENLRELCPHAVNGASCRRDGEERLAGGEIFEQLRRYGSPGLTQ